MDPRFPNLFILGAPKCGTTSLYRYLEEHPGVYFPVNKEPQYFCNDEIFEKGCGYYLDTHFKNAAPFSIRGDATPHYLYYEKVARRLAGLDNDGALKFIVILREPVARAYSHYWNMVQEGYEELSFEDAIAAEIRRLEDPEWERLGVLRVNYVSAGMYAEQLRRFFCYFPRQKFLVLLQEDLQGAPKETMSAVFNFLGIDEIIVKKPDRHNPAGATRSVMLQRFIRRPNKLRRVLGGWLPYSAKYRIAQMLLMVNKKVLPYPPIGKALQMKISRRFESDICDLEELLGRDLSHWKHFSRPESAK